MKTVTSSDPFPGDMQTAWKLFVGGTTKERLMTGMGLHMAAIQLAFILDARISPRQKTLRNKTRRELGNERRERQPRETRLRRSGTENGMSVERSRVPLSRDARQGGRLGGPLRTPRGNATIES